jgi:hypothetical protein
MQVIVFPSIGSEVRMRKEPTFAALFPHVSFAVGFPANRENTRQPKTSQHEIDLSWLADSKQQLTSAQR